MDKTTFGGLLLGFGCILGGQALEGGNIHSLMQLAAAIIVLGGTVGATMVAYPFKDFMHGVKMGKRGFTEKSIDLVGIVKAVVDLAQIARRDGVLALEQQLPTVKDPFMKRALGYVVDGVEASVTRSALEAEIDTEYEEDAVGAKVFETAGGFAPTVGIIGAVLGLIHVMENLNDPSKLGGGIATAFVATVYGVAVANLVFLPLAAKLKRRLVLERERKTVIAEGVLSIQEGLNPRIIEEKLKAYLGSHAHALTAAAPKAKA
jgi:chemotaxis protein MotA